MRYVAKVHVLDVLDQVVVSGYIHACPDRGGDSPEVYEFSLSVPGVGEPGPVAWLARALSGLSYRQWEEGLTGLHGTAVPGGGYTLYESGSRSGSVMG